MSRSRLLLLLHRMRSVIGGCSCGCSSSTGGNRVHEYAFVGTGTSSRISRCRRCCRISSSIVIGSGATRVRRRRTNAVRAARRRRRGGSTGTGTSCGWTRTRLCRWSERASSRMRCPGTCCCSCSCSCCRTSRRLRTPASHTRWGCRGCC